MEKSRFFFQFGDYVKSYLVAFSEYINFTPDIFQDELQVDDKTEPANKMGKEEAIVKASDVNPNPALAPAVVEA